MAAVVINPQPATIVTMERVINKASHATVAETVAHVIAEVEDHGMKLFTTIDHSAKARVAGLELRETTLRWRTRGGQRAARKKG